VSYPTLTMKPVYPLSVTLGDNVISSSKDAGYRHKRARFTRMPKIFELNYVAMSHEDLQLLLNHYNSVSGASSFFWVNDGEAAEAPKRLSNHAYVSGDIIRPVVYDGHSYKCTTAGTSGSSSPTFVTTENQTTSDGTVTWTENSYTVTYAEPITWKYVEGGLIEVTVKLEEV